MATYTPNKMMVPTGFDEIGLKIGMQRLSSESLAHYRDRLVAEVRDPSGATEPQYIRTAGRQVGLPDVAVFEIDLALDGNGDPLAPDPFIEVTYTHFRAYSDYDNETLDIEIDLTDRSTGYFLREVYNALVASSFFDVVILDDDYTYKRALNLRVDNTERVITSEVVTKARVHKFAKKYVRDVSLTAFDLVETEVASPAAISENGEFHIDYVEGVVWFNEAARGFATYTFRNFPYRLYWQPVRVVPMNAADREYYFRDTIIDDETGLEVHDKLNSDGAEIYNNVLAVSPLGWGK